MYKVEIICIGNELLSGITLNTNAQWLANQITKVGGVVKTIIVVGDDTKMKLRLLYENH